MSSEKLTSTGANDVSGKKSSRERELREKNKSLEKRVTDLENEVSRLNDEIDSLKDLFTAKAAANNAQRSPKKNNRVGTRSQTDREFLTVISFELKVNGKQWRCALLWNLLKKYS